MSEKISAAEIARLLEAVNEAMRDGGAPNALFVSRAFYRDLLISHATLQREADEAQGKIEYLAKVRDDQSDLINALVREADGLREALGWVGEVYPATNPESGGAIVHMTWDQFNAMREQVGLKPVKGRRSPQVEAEKGSDRD